MVIFQSIIYQLFKFLANIWELHCTFASKGCEKFHLTIPPSLRKQKVSLKLSLVILGLSEKLICLSKLVFTYIHYKYVRARFFSKTYFILEG